MAGKNQVTLTFAGDSKSLESTYKQVGAGSKKVEDNFDKMGKAAKDVEDNLKGAGQAGEKASEGIEEMSDEARRAQDELDKLAKSQDRLNKFVGDGGRKIEDYGTGIGGVGDRFDELDTRAMGAADGLAGATDAMKWGTLTAQEQAMVLSDMGSSMYNFVIPQVQSLGKNVTSMVTQMGGIKNVLIAGGAIAAIAGVGYALMESSKQAHDAHFDEVAEDLKETGNSAKAAREALGDPGKDFEMMFSGAASDLGNLNEVISRLVKDGQFEEANDLIEEAGRRGDITGQEMAEYKRILDNLQGSSEGAAATQKELADSIRGVNEAQQAAVDPVYAVIDADNQLRDANQAIAEALVAVNEAVKEHGENSPEAVAAMEAFRDANLDAGQAVLDNEAAIGELTAAAVENPGIMDEVVGRLQNLADQGVISQSVVDTVSRALRDVPRRTDSRLQAHDAASRAIEGVKGALRALNGESATVTIQAQVSAAAQQALAALRSAMFADGGVVPQYMASGGYGPRGTDTVPAWLTPGEMVLNAGQQAQLWAMANGRGGGGGVTVNLTVQGSLLTQRDLMGVIHDELRRGGFGGLAA